MNCSTEAVVLRTWPLAEADLIVSLFTRDFGRLKGVAKAALKSRKRFGGTLEPMTVVRVWFADRAGQDLARLDQMEVVRSPLSARVDVARMAVLTFYAEVLDEALPERDPQETVFRLLISVLEQTQAAQSDRIQPWMAMTYFSLWMTRLMGLLPETGRCTTCGEPLRAGEVWFSRYADGLFCDLHRNGTGSLLSADSWLLSQRMLHAPAAGFAGEDWPRRRAHDLRRFAVQSLERHLERRLRSWEMLERISG